MSSIADVDTVLNRRRKTKACYPCSTRKVRCLGTRPCPTCVRRGHPEICIDNNQARRGQQSGAAGDVATRTVSASVDAASATHDVQNMHESYPVTTDVSQQRPPQTDSEANTAEESNCELQDTNMISPSYVGANSTMSYVHTSAFATDPEFGQDMRPALGLQNTLEQYPFMRKAPTVHAATSSAPQSTEELQLDHSDIFKYSEFFQNRIYPFLPSIIHTRDLDALICLFMEMTSSSASSVSSTTRQRSRQTHAAETSLMCAILASGAQYSDLPTTRRAQVSRDFARKSFHCARLANFLLRPTVPIIQALLILCHVMQNDGQADAAWALLGTTARLAQSVGLHSCDNGPESSPFIWSGILCQDCLLSMAFDRTPISSSENRMPTLSMGYPDRLYMLTKVGRKFLMTPHTERANVQTASNLLAQLQELQRQLQSQLEVQNEHHSLHAGRRARMERYAFDLHLAFVRSVICRAFLKHSGGNSEAEEALGTIARSSFVDTMQAFVDLRSLTIVPLRSWSMIHAALSSALLLEVFGLPSENTSLATGGQSALSRDVQSRFITALSAEPIPGGLTQYASDEQNWLSAPHSKALNALKRSMHAKERQTAPSRQSLPSKLPSVNGAANQKPSNDVQQEEQFNINELEKRMTIVASGSSEASGGGTAGFDIQYDQGLDDLPLDSLGNIDWGDSYFDNDSSLDYQSTQAQWGIW